MATTLAASIAVASARGSPVRAGGLERSDTWAALFLALLAASFGLYLGALLVLRSRGGNLTLVCLLAVAIQLAPLAGPLLLSRDAYSYWAYGRIVASHHRNPFTLAPARFPHDPSTRAVARAWRRQVSVYGPAFTAASAGLGQLAKRSAETASFLFRAAAAVAGVGATLLAAMLARRKAYAAAFIGWNPLLAISFAGGGHNDAWMLVLLLASLALVAQRRDVAGGAPLDSRRGDQGTRAPDPSAAAPSLPSRRLDRRRGRRDCDRRRRNGGVRDRMDDVRPAGRPAGVALRAPRTPPAARGTCAHFPSAGIRSTRRRRALART